MPGAKLIYRLAMIRLLLSILIAVGMSASPLVMASAKAHAIGSIDTVATMSHAGHCADAEKAPGKGKQSPDACCVGVCTAVLPAQAIMQQNRPQFQQLTIALIHQLFPGRAPEQDPPPPRIASEI